MARKSKNEVEENQVNGDVIILVPSEAEESSINQEADNSEKGGENSEELTEANAQTDQENYSDEENSEYETEQEEYVEEDISEKKSNVSKGKKYRIISEIVTTVIVLITTLVLFIISAAFINPNRNDGNHSNALLNLYYIIFILFSIFVIGICVILKLNTYSMINFYNKIIHKDGHYSSLSSSRKNINNICNAYKKSFIVSGDEDYHKTRANSDLYFGVDTWLQDMNFFPLQTFLKIIPGTFIGFGILGTFIGFTSGIEGMNFNTNDMTEIMKSVQLLLGGVSTAFNTSIVGVLASVYLNFVVIHPFLNRINGISKDLCDYLDSKFYVTEVDAMAILDENHNLKPFPVTMNEMMSKLETVASNINHLGNTVGSQVTQSIKNTMDETIEGIIRGEINKLKEEFSTIIETLKECSAYLQAAPQNIKEAAGVMKTTSADVYDSYLNTMNEISDVMNKVNEAMDKLPGNLLAVTGSIDTTSQKIIDNTEAFSQSFDRSTMALAQTSELSARMVQSYEAQVAVIGNSAAQIEKVISESNQVTKTSKELLEGYTTVDEHLAKIFAEVNKNTEKYSSILSDSLIGYFKQFQDATKDISKQFAEATMQLSEEIAKLNSRK